MTNPFVRLMTRRARGQEPEMEQCKQLRKLLRPIYRPGMTILDVGCGTGHFLPSLRKLDANVAYTGVDWSEPILKRARRLFPDATFVRGDVRALRNFRPSSYDIVLCYLLLLHLKDFKQPVRELFRVARRHLFVRTTIADTRYDVKRYLARSRRYFYYNIFSEDEIVSHLKRLRARAVRVIDDAFRANIPRVNSWKTYTVRSPYGKLQIFGNLVMSWKVVHARKY